MTGWRLKLILTIYPRPWREHDGDDLDRLISDLQHEQLSPTRRTRHTLDLSRTASSSEPGIPSLAAD
jgi:hypothetical protein